MQIDTTRTSNDRVVVCGKHDDERSESLANASGLPFQFIFTRIDVSILLSGRSYFKR
jgi:hypothetical protein